MAMRPQVKGIVVTYGGVTQRYTKGLTNRRCQLIMSMILTAAGVAGFLAPSSPGDMYDMGIGQSIAYVIMGVFTWYVGEVWNSPVKRGYNIVIGAFFLGIAIAGFVIAAVGNDPMGNNLYLFHVSHPWENAAHLTIGVIFMATALYRRRFREYSVGSAVSD
ncbi:MAG: hypothetical protein BZY88_11555 [SAR202 cluster bacterium Io17-Chloro-G9]|nr:MAG: hypothetical protein BZY88_11555 [SAR202 cluster bacterium Io17-Chloro-G9]